jgi:3',5'-cyclic AMP phosphodiesterase CpdA
MPIHLGDARTVTRRGFLGTVAAGAAALAVGRGAGAREEDQEGWYALVSDTHIAADPATVARDQTMARNLEAVVADVLAKKGSPLGIFVDGDLAMRTGEAADYETFLNLAKPWTSANLPLHLTLGNHDDRGHFSKALAIGPETEAVVSKHVSIVDGPGLRFLMLDSLDRPNVTPGILGEAQIAWLGKTLDARPETPTIVFLHHNLSENQGALTDTRALLDTLVPRKQAKAVVFGHTHVWSVKEQDGLHMVNLPAVGYPFAADQPLGWVEMRPERAGASLVLHALGGDKAKDGERVELAWR